MNRQNMRDINIKIDLNYDFIRETFDMGCNNYYYQSNLKNINFNSITTDMYIHIIEMTKSTFDNLIKIMKSNKRIIELANLNISYLTPKIEICKMRLNVLSDVLEYISIILNLSFKIKSFLEKLLYKYNYDIVQNYYCRYQLLINKLQKTYFDGTKMIGEACKYLKACEDDSKEILELFPIDDDYVEIMDNSYLSQLNIHSGVDNGTVASITNIIELSNDM